MLHSCFADVFVPFKTPLDGSYDDQVPEECRFPVSMLLDSLKGFKVAVFFFLYDY